ncbi:hypothetical protein GCM10017691_10910 [Pseudonocardia petroleophila]|uniref:general stress protein n=1 Tax=Pseudonocardia petroleophila TaxID=37331 RepID=UPI001C8B745C|nr:general stress protein [Pseudonocardia petroleophila]
MQNPSKVVATYRDYADAQRAVDALADQHFPVGGLAIVGANLQSYEQITGRRGFARAAGSGFTSGALTGALIGWLLGIFNIAQPLVSALVMALFGLVLGGVVGLVSACSPTWPPADAGTSPRSPRSGPSTTTCWP